MICFEVWVNGEKFCVAGIGEAGVLSAHVTWSERAREENDAPSERERSKPRLHVGGLVNKEHIRWTEMGNTLEVGEEVLFKIIEADVADDPIRKESQGSPKEKRQRRYQNYQLLKREFDGVENFEETDSDDSWLLRFKLMTQYQEEFEERKRRQRDEEKEASA